MATPLASAFIRVRPDTSTFKSDAEKGIGDAGASAGRKFGDEFTRNSRSRLSNNRGQFVKEFQDQGKSAGEKSGSAFGSTFGGHLSSLAKVAATAFAGIGAVSLFKDFISEARESINTGKATAAVLKSTGSVANVSADQVGNLATAISNKIGVDDEAIQSGENLLLTFKNVRNEAGAGNNIFDQTTQAMVDMTAAMNNGQVTTEGMKSSTIQLGKALNDPVKGITALTRVGVTFSDQQKKQIADMVKSGNTLGAQKIILKEVQSEFGGAAEAAADPVQKMSVAWGNFEETVGLLILPILTRVANLISGTVLPAVLRFGAQLGTQLGPSFERLRANIAALLPNILAMVSRFLSLARTIGTEVGPPLAELATAVLPAFGVAARVIVSTLSSLFGFLSNGSTTATVLRGAIYGLIAGFVLWKTVTIAASTATKLWAAAQALLNLALDANPIGAIVLGIGALIGILVIAYQRSATFRNIVNATWNAIRTGFQVMWSYVGPILGTIFKVYLQALILEFKVFWTVVQFVYNAVRTGLQALWSVAGPILGTLFKLYIHALALEFRTFWAVVQFVWNAVRTVISTVYNVIKPIIGVYIKTYLIALRTEFNLFRSAVQTVWNAIRNAITTAYSVIKPIISVLIKAHLIALRTEFNVFRSVVQTVWRAVQGATTAAWSVINNIFGRIKSGLNTVAGNFRTGASAIGSAWHRIQDLTKAPVNFVIGTVFNRGIKGLWDKVTGWLHLESLRFGSIPLLESGGAIPAQPGVFNRPTAIVGEGNPNYPEFVIPTDPKYRSNASALWQAAGSHMQMLQGGGILGGILSGVKHVASKVLNIGKDALDLITNPGKVWDRLVSQFVPSASGVATSPFGSAVAAIPKLILNKAKDYALSVFKAFSAGYGGGAMGVVRKARTQIGMPYSWGGGGLGGPSYGIGRGANTFGFDCSGLTEYAWGAEHIDIGGSTGPQAANSHSISGPKPGALAFVGNPIHHVMLGSDKSGFVIQAPHTGAFVEEVRRSSSNWRWPNAAKMAGGGFLDKIGRAFEEDRLPRSTMNALVASGFAGGPSRTRGQRGVFDSGGFGVGWPFHPTRPEAVFTDQQWNSIHKLASNTQPIIGTLNVTGLPDIPSDKQIANAIKRNQDLHGKRW